MVRGRFTVSDSGMGCELVAQRPRSEGELGPESCQVIYTQSNITVGFTEEGSMCLEYTQPRNLQHISSSLVGN